MGAVHIMMPFEDVDALSYISGRTTKLVRWPLSLEKKRESRTTCPTLSLSISLVCDGTSLFSKWISGFLHRPVDKWNLITSPHLLIGWSDPVFPISTQKLRCNNLATLFFQRKSSLSSFRCDGKSDNYHII